MTYVVETDVPDVVYAIGGKEIANSEAGRLLHDLFAMLYYENPDCAMEYYKKRVEALGIDISDVLFWEG